jgi:hypothetical protein
VEAQAKGFVEFIERLSLGSGLEIPEGSRQISYHPANGGQEPEQPHFHRQ